MIILNYRENIKLLKISLNIKKGYNWDMWKFLFLWKVSNSMIDVIIDEEIKKMFQFTLKTKNKIRYLHIL